VLDRVEPLIPHAIWKIVILVLFVI
jgi:hypothetical protein